MLPHDRFSSLRLAQIFSADVVNSYPYYIEIDPDGDFDMEYQGGGWHEELIDGVQFFYPRKAGAKLGIVELWGAGAVLAAAVRDRPAPIPLLFVAAWQSNADRVLEALDLSLRMGSPEADLRQLAAGPINASPYPDDWYDRHPGLAKGSLSMLSFACRAPDLYHIQAVSHATEGLLSFAIRRPDLIRQNEREKGTYDECVGWLFGDEES